MNILHIIRIVKAGWKNIYLHKLRSLLTMLGIVFGVASVIAMLAIGEGASYEAMEQIKALGSNNIIVRAIKPEKDATQQGVRLAVYGLTHQDMSRLKNVPSVGKFVSAWEARKDIWHYEKTMPARVVGTQTEYFEVMNLSIRSGRTFSEVDYKLKNPVVVLGSSIKNVLFPLDDPIGKQIKIGRSYFTVIGVVSERSAVSGVGFEAEDVNYDVYMPLTASRIYFGEFVTGETNDDRSWVQYHRFILRVNEQEHILTTASITENILKTLHSKPDYEILVPLQLLIQAENTRRIFNIVLGAIAAISLVVGGIGIMNIMLATVTERTREIGIRRAVGAKKKDIIHQFLTEAVILSSLGGFIGVFLGVTIPFFVTRFADMATIITYWSVLVAFCISVAVGITFGLYPARKAADLNPIEALRYE